MNQKEQPIQFTLRVPRVFATKEDLHLERMAREARYEESERTLDARVAEHVMGWVLIMHEPITKQCMGVPPNTSLDLSQEIPYYSTDIAAAWKVVERFIFPMNTPEAYHLRSSFDYYMEEEKLHFWNAYRAARVICQVALKTVGYEPTPEVL